MPFAPAPDDAMQAFQQRFAALQRDWREHLPQRLAEVQGAMGACTAAPGDQAALQVLHRQLHTLAGSAGSFGMPGLGALARDVEDELDRLLAQRPRHASDFDEAQRRLQAMLQASELRA